MCSTITPKNSVGMSSLKTSSLVERFWDISCGTCGWKSEDLGSPSCSGNGAHTTGVRGFSSWFCGWKSRSSEDLGSTSCSGYGAHTTG